MEPIVWIAVASVVLVVLHLSIVGYLYRKGLEEANVQSDPGPAQSRVDSVEQAEVDEDLVHCRTCGTANEPGYRYCRSCVSELSTRSWGAPDGKNAGRLQS